jgi:osmoprotectant transport system substrate-binding protein
VASGSSTEQLLAGKLTVLALRQNGYLVNDRTGFTTTSEARTALLAGKVDMGWFFTGEVWAKDMGHDLAIKNSDQLAQAVAAEDELRGIIWTSPSSYVLRLGLVMREADLGRAPIAKISELAAYSARIQPLTLCAPDELIGIFSGIREFLQVYDLAISADHIQTRPIAEGYQALLRGDCNCALGYSVDINGSETLRFLEDDKAFFPTSGFALALRQEVDERYPNMQQVLDRVSYWLTPANISTLVELVEHDGLSPEDAAQQFIKRHH